MVETVSPRVVPLDLSMIDGLMALSTAAHWNQNEADWRSMLRLGRGWGVKVVDAHGVPRLAASTIVLPYEDRFAWISMVLVLPAWRAQGFAGGLLDVALEDLAARRLTPVLDATPAGHPVYRKHGFADTWGFGRWRRQGGAGRYASAVRADEAPAGAQLRPLRESDWPAVAALDAPAFGASRLPLLQQLARRLPAAAWVLVQHDTVRAVLLGRDGRTAMQLGPLVVDGVDALAAAKALLGAALEALRRRSVGEQPTVIVDVRDGQAELQAWLESRGFAFERPFTRMVHGADRAPGDPERTVLVAGPELG
jgi:GNAT superfamily N-acetyltransferase